MSKELIERLRSPLADCEGIGLCEEAADTIEQQAAEIARLRAEWMLIDSAPKDGNEIIGWAEDAGRVICHWGKHNHVPMYGWIRRVELYGEEVDSFDPTHWMPLPAEPTPQTSACTQSADAAPSPPNTHD